MSDTQLRKRLIRLAYEKPKLRAEILPLVASNRTAGKLRMDSGRVEQQATKGLRELKRIPAKNKGDLNSALLSAGYYAQKQDRTMYLYAGNSYGHAVWRVTYKENEYLDPINNTGKAMFSVTPELEVRRHQVSGGIHQRG